MEHEGEDDHGDHGLDDHHTDETPLVSAPIHLEEEKAHIAPSDADTEVAPQQGSDVGDEDVGLKKTAFENELNSTKVSLKQQPASFLQTDVADFLEDIAELSVLNAMELSGIVRHEVVTPQEMIQAYVFMGFFSSEEQKEPESPAVWRIANATTYHKVFYNCSRRTLMKSLSALGLAVGEEGDDFYLFWKGDRASLGTVVGILSDIETIFSYKNVFNFEYILKHTFRLASEVIMERCPYVEGIKEHLSSYKVKPTVLSGASFMLPFECSFETNVGERVLSYPDVYDLPEKHFEYMLKRYRKPNAGALYIHLYHLCYYVMCHEVIHCVQHAAKQKDSNPLSWSAEHDASFVSLSLFRGIAARKDTIKTVLFHAGLLDQVLAIAYTQAVAYKKRWTPICEEEYKRWRNSFAMEAPNAAVGNNSQLTSEFKEVLAVEYFFDGDDELQAQLDLLFKDRTGNVYFQNLIIPSPLHIDEDKRVVKEATPFLASGIGPL